ncbi:hypothetical protein B0T17DRAFT_590000 [Bombardia bombarda]|uniref:Uncharacterized protein n=1 Tax=Bombardia bombarda TaxID=252184 RepID=A0AA39XAT8_9PEZI|nr:hypothetical protein B0T17DRAFT_590000 [Bombardia bombarda]
MSPKLKPLILPQLVEERRKQELQHQQLNDAEHAYMYSSHSSSSSDIASPSPVTPTFSRNGNARYSASASTSSLETMPSSCSESPASPMQPPAHNNNSKASSKSQLPDVQEDPLEREEDEDTTPVPGYGDSEFGLYDCLCVEPCRHHEDLTHSATSHSYMPSELDLDFFIVSRGGNSRQKTRRHGSDAGFSSWGTRLGSKLPSLPRWGSTSRRNQFAFSPASDPYLDQRPGFSRTASSRSSSISVPIQTLSDRANEPPLPATPALSFYESTDSVVLPSPLDAMQATVGRSLERERAMATTPLLPPLMTDSAARQSQTNSLQPSPLQSPSIAPSPFPELWAPSPQTYPTPPLSTKASVSSFRRGTVSSTTSDIPSPIPFLLDHQDAWSDRLGHANFTIEPKPYTPEIADLGTLQLFHDDWNHAKINYTRHLVRTGEHYGATSKTYVLTEAKWDEIDREWHKAEDELVQRLNPRGNGDSIKSLHLRRVTEEMFPAAIPRMLSDDGKFPERGDVDIVGPMVRDAVMVRGGHDEKKHGSASVWLKNLAEKVGLRR